MKDKLNIIFARNSDLLFDQINRKIIREFYEQSKTKSKLWIWWNKNIIVTRYESLKDKRDLDKEINRSIKDLFIFKLITKMLRFW